MKNAEQKLENSKKSANDAIQKAQSDVQNAEDKMNREFGAYILHTQQRLLTHRTQVTPNAPFKMRRTRSIAFRRTSIPPRTASATPNGMTRLGWRPTSGKTSRANRP